MTVNVKDANMTSDMTSHDNATLWTSTHNTGGQWTWQHLDMRAEGSFKVCAACADP